MPSFTIDNIELFANEILDDEFVVSSHPSSYLVKFSNFEQTWTENDVILIDSKIKSIYNINHTKVFELEANENEKTIETSLRLCEYLLSINFNKHNILHVIGGGIVQDIGAFTSKMFKRGVNWYYYPTTLLSQCDSCIGGKTALNFSSYKNQLALFSAPSKVIIDCNFLSSLSKEELISGNGEIIKLFITGGKYYIDNYEKWTIQERIKHSLAIKKAVVEYDEFEINIRKALNYGHTFGHIIESLTNYRISHGKAIILGMYIISKIFYTDQSVIDFISKFVCFEDLKSLQAEKLFSLISTDKKAIGSGINFVHSPNFGLTNFELCEIDNSLLEKLNEIFTD